MARKKSTASKKGVKVVLAPDLTIRHATPQKAALAEALQKPGETIVIDASALADVDTAGVQLLAAFVSAARSAGRTVQWLQPPTVLRDACVALGIGSALALPVAA